MTHDVLVLDLLPRLSCLRWFFGSTSLRVSTSSGESSSYSRKQLFPFRILLQRFFV